MRHAIRIQPYISRDLCQKLRAYAAARSLTVSAVIADALGEYLGRDEVEDALIVRRLDAIAQAVGALQRDVDVLGTGFGRSVLYSFFSTPTEMPRELVRRANSFYKDFLRRTAGDVRGGVRFTRLVLGHLRQGGSSASEATEEGGREKEGQS